MHPHLHTKDNKGCEEIMTALDECHAQGFLWKAMGMCSNIKRDVNKCLRAERLERTASNREQAKEKRQKVQAVWAEIDANS
ncbi:hypothetical protein KC343_g11941, partial [Hortaea werneckii]|uniref:COX assembly mitochondrial protein n=2 Tax=Hortaea werneckii TaxID=91943 RepID=A0A3M7B570_HORWE|nr:hypothetical protein KC350_g13953 [Hortaea werneckii]KAI6823948.1 hypothetical protein KC358_g8397 [Hortaea werneckii]KAI6833366.1 hypothetical protein KC342_g6810 [Hortaea werneckii]KAI6874844.1 hypothetical protein KC338_g1032 [Hortaea werneckii]KAI6925957.1 hypothetical protein KC348_g8825 [Hortaea werneckii]